MRLPIKMTTDDDVSQSEMVHFNDVAIIMYTSMYSL